jgi:hypothetical protein
MYIHKKLKQFGSSSSSVEVALRISEINLLGVAFIMGERAHNTHAGSMEQQ